MEQKELDEILESHKRWLRSEGGECANLHGADLRSARLLWADLTGANLTEADLRQADLRRANLCRANLIGANLIGANLRRANLRRANLCRADLIGADLIGANLIGANLIGANLREADLRYANFTEASFLSVLCVQVNTSCENRKITYIPSLNVVTAGCFQGTFAEFEKRVEEEHKDNPFVLSRYRRVIAFLKREAEEDRAREKEMATVDEERR